MFQGHGDDGYLYSQPIIADFSTNVYAGGAAPGLKEYLFSRWDKVHSYPEVLAESLSKKITVHYGLAEGSVLVTNGSTESIYLIAQAYKRKSTGIVIPAFAEYEDACKLHEHKLRFILWDELNPGALSGIDLLFICHPNNPTGAVYPDLQLLIAQYPEVLFVVDEAFIEFTYSVTSLVGLTAQYSNLVIMRSMTKAYAIPGLRLGYIVARPLIIEKLKSAKLPWSVNVMAVEAGHFIFDHLDELQLPLGQLLADRHAFTRCLLQAPLIIQESHTHFFLAQLQAGTGAALKQFLLKEFNLLIRDAGNFRGLTERHIRIATLSPAKNQLLINALSTWKPL